MENVGAHRDANVTTWTRGDAPRTCGGADVDARWRSVTGGRRGGRYPTYYANVTGMKTNYFNFEQGAPRPAGGGGCSGGCASQWLNVIATYGCNG